MLNIHKPGLLSLGHHPDIQLGGFERSLNVCCIDKIENSVHFSLRRFEFDFEVFIVKVSKD